MTGNKILEDAVSLMGFEVPSEEMKKIAPTVINFVLEDLGEAAVETLEQDLSLNEALASTCIAGAAMLLSAALGDLRAKECFSVLYNEKRSRVKSTKTSIVNSLPKGELL